MATAIQPDLLPTNKLAAVTILFPVFDRWLEPAIVEFWAAIVPTALATPGISGLIGALVSTLLPAFIAYQFVPDRANVPT